MQERTVLFHMTNVYRKLGLTSFKKAVRQRELGKYCELIPQAHVNIAPGRRTITMIDKSEPHQEPNIKIPNAVEDDTHSHDSGLRMLKRSYMILASAFCAFLLLLWLAFSYNNSLQNSPTEEVITSATEKPTSTIYSLTKVETPLAISSPSTT